MITSKKLKDIKIDLLKQQGPVNSNKFHLNTYYRNMYKEDHTKPKITFLEKLMHTEGPKNIDY